MHAMFVLLSLVPGHASDVGLLSLVYCVLHTRFNAITAHSYWLQMIGITAA